VLLDPAPNDIAATMATAFFAQLLEHSVSGRQFAITNIVQRCATLYSFAFLLLPHLEQYHELVSTALEYNPTTILVAVAIGDQLYPVFKEHIQNQRVKRGLRHPQFLQGNRRILNITSQDRIGSPQFPASMRVQTHDLQSRLEDTFQPAVLYVYEENHADDVAFMWDFDALVKHFDASTEGGQLLRFMMVSYPTEEDEVAENTLRMLGVNERPALFFFPAGCKLGIEYRNILVVGQPEPPVAWVARRLQGTEEGEWSLATVAPILKDAYEGDAGYAIPEEEEKHIVDASKDRRWWFQKLASFNQNSAVYGELTTEGVHNLIELLNLTREDVFWDLGCGVGKAVVQVALETDVAASRGVELSASRVKHGLESLQTLRSTTRKRSVEEQECIDKIQERITLLSSDISDTDFSDGTHIYAGSLLFPDALMEDIADKLMDANAKAQSFSTLRRFPDAVEAKFKKRLKLWKTVDISVSWQEMTELYIYRIRAPREAGP